MLRSKITRDRLEQLTKEELVDVVLAFNTDLIALEMFGELTKEAVFKTQTAVFDMTALAGTEES